MHDLTPTSFEDLLLPSGRTFRIPKSEPRFKIWNGSQIDFSYGGKDILDVRGEPVFAEIAILRLLQYEGWDGVWVDTFQKKYRKSNTEFVEIDPKKEELLNQISDKANSNNGCFDVFAWKNGEYRFVESKKKSKDRIRETQLIWLESALDTGIDEDSFLIAEWDIDGH